MRVRSLALRLVGLLVLGAALLLVGAVPVALALVDVFDDVNVAIAALTDSLLWERLATTGWILAGTLAVSLPLGVALAWVLSRTDVPGAGWMRVLLPLPLFLPPLVHVLTWFGMLRLTGLPAIILVYAISFTPLVVLLAGRALDQISREQAETWRLLGGRLAVLLAELRHTWPAATIGAALIIAFVLADFAVADFLSSVGPNVTVYADTLYVHYLGMRPASVAAVSLPGIVLALMVLALGLRSRSKLAAGVGSRFEPAPRLPLKWLRWPVFALAAAWLALGSVVPLVALAVQAESFERIATQAERYSSAIETSIFIGAAAAIGMVVFALLLGMATRTWGRRRRLALDLLVALPLAVPPLLFGVGLIRQWNHPAFDAIYLGPAVVILALIGRYLAFAVLPIQGALERIDERLDDAARLAGAGPFERFRCILLPLLARPIAVAACLAYGFTLREIDVLIMLRAGQETLPWHLYSNVIFAQPADVAALALLLALITVTPLVIVLAVLRHPIRIL